MAPLSSLRSQGCRCPVGETMTKATVLASGGREFPAEVIGWKREKVTVLLVKIPMNGVYEFDARTGAGAGRAGKFGMKLSAESAEWARGYARSSGRMR